MNIAIIGYRDMCSHEELVTGHLTQRNRTDEGVCHVVLLFPSHNQNERKVRDMASLTLDVSCFLRNVPVN